MAGYHTSVLLQEVLDHLAIQKGKKYIDATLGGGGHTLEILKKGGQVLGIDADEDAIAHVEKILKEKDIKILCKKKNESLNISISEYPNITLVRGNFRDIYQIARETNFEEIAGVLLDLGISSYQVDTPERGFSFQKSGPLDMRMDNRLGVTASDLVNSLTKAQLYDLFHSYGEEKNAWTISDRIVRARSVKPIKTTDDLAEIVYWAVGRFDKTNPATRIFQALRIVINDELTAVEEALPKAFRLLEKKGRLAIISFHSLEDRIVKHFAKEQEGKKKGIQLTRKPIIPSEKEQDSNPRSRSAKLRIIEKL